ncbi:MAG: GAF domain-containing protein [Deltaproteobacteria bacterium]|nr:GAF domain-containing protein [Deltaproteobacteria bacterium]
MPPVSKPGVRVGGEDLITDLFEAMSELHYLDDAQQGAAFVLTLAMEKLPSEAGLVSLFDIDTREFVVVKQTGGSKSGLLLRLSERAELQRKAMRSTKAIVLSKLDDSAKIDSRWDQIGVEPRSLICAPVERGGRYLGLVELANPLDGKNFSAADGNALEYIGEQFGEFLSERGVLIDPDEVVANAEADVD